MLLTSKRLYIFDLDGTLANIDHRLHHINSPATLCSGCGGKGCVGETRGGELCIDTCERCDGTGRYAGPQDWDAFFAACPQDFPIPATLWTMRSLRVAGADVEIWSGRSEVVRPETEAWLFEHTGLSWEMRMRPAGDRTDDNKLKHQWYQELGAADKARLMAVFEDRSRVVKMWRSLGVTCYQVAEGGF